MTVISAVLSKQGIGVATDSFLTYQDINGTRKCVESQESKIVVVDKFKLIFSYWGFAGTKSDPLITKKALKKCVGLSGKHSGVISFLENVKKEIGSLINGFPGNGIGIHVTAIEKWNNYSIPELFLISNFTDTTYSSLKQIELTRRSWFHHPDNTKHEIEKLDGEINKRLSVKKYLDSGIILNFNNGDPFLFNQFANTYQLVMQTAYKRGALKFDLDSIAAMAKLPIQAISQMQQTIYKKSERIVGGRVHSMVIEPNGEIRKSN